MNHLNPHPGNTNGGGGLLRILMKTLNLLTLLIFLGIQRPEVAKAVSTSVIVVLCSTKGADILARSVLKMVLIAN